MREIMPEFSKVLLAQHLRFSLVGTPSHTARILHCSLFLRPEPFFCRERVEDGRIRAPRCPRVQRQKPRDTILGRVVAPSFCRVTLRYPFLVGTRNLESRSGVRHIEK
jgi:hypothetical protein